MTDREQDDVNETPRLHSRLAVALVSLVVLASLALVALDRLLLPGRFAIQEVIVTGDAPNVDPAAVLDAVRSLGERSWFSVDLVAVERAVAGVPWVYQASVRRRWPGKLVVQVSQATPFARYNDSAWINRQGEVLALPGDFAGQALPRLAGPRERASEVTAYYLHVRQRMAGAGSVEVRSLRLDARGAWQMGIGAEDDRVVPVSLGREAIDERLARFTAALAGGLASRLAGIEAIDLRYPNGLAVRPLDPAPGRQMAEQKSQSGDGTG